MSRTIYSTGVWLLVGLLGTMAAWGDEAAESAAVVPEQQAADRGPAEVSAARAAELRAAVRQAIKRLPKRGLPTADAVRELVELYRQLEADEALPGSERLRLRGAVRTRLVCIYKRLVKELESRPEAAGGQPSALEAQGEGHDPAARSRPGAARLPPGTSRGKAAAAGSALPAEEQASQPQNGGGASALDHGQQLVELIQDVVRPDIWDVNGGPAVIRYYSPLKVLVVTAPGDVHGDVGAVLDGLR